MWVYMYLFKCMNMHTHMNMCMNTIMNINMNTNMNMNVDTNMNVSMNMTMNMTLYADTHIYANVLHFLFLVGGHRVMSYIVFC